MQNLELFKGILETQSVSYNQIAMISKIKLELSKMTNVTFYEHRENIYVTKKTFKTDFVPCIVSHMDTVHSITSDLTCLQIGNDITGFNRITMHQSGIGGDDKVGIFICLQCLEYFDNCKVVFFSNEEVGCIGSYDAKMKFFNDCSFVLQCDRKGSDDFVINASGVELSDNYFQDSILPTLQNYGYNFSDGGMTDVMTLKENDLKICCANISCGYYNPHQSCEYVNIIDVENCKNMVFELFSKFGGIQFLHTKTKKSYKYDFTQFEFNKYGNEQIDSKFFNDDDLNMPYNNYSCDNCLNEVEFINEIDDYFCPNCMMYGHEIKEYILPY